MVNLGINSLEPAEVLFSTMKFRTQSPGLGDKPKSASFKQRMVACLSVCFLSSAVSDDEVSMLQELLAEL